ncbi:hypothetical protein HMPREF9141_1237 [Prevotella multiformis DSM 16608]|uniref:Uncharacterized protein n=1 Tax=Prevotella multiformis DSM 16608 TaxID=888743 RepID=F0F6L5_9BACT|nr:hypothetical protein HMPREF9141_1237 [Prevotella multiformis DSM 16608]
MCPHIITACHPFTGATGCTLSGKTGHGSTIPHIGCSAPEKTLRHQQDGFCSMTGKARKRLPPPAIKTTPA